MECALGPGGMAPAQSCLPLSPGLGCPPLPPLPPGATGPTWPSTVGMGLGAVVEVRGVRAWCTHPMASGGSVQGSPLLASGYGCATLRDLCSPSTQGLSVAV